MKISTLLFICFFLLLMISQKGFAQLTKLSNNTSLRGSIPLGNKAILSGKNDSIWITDGTPAGTARLTNKATLRGDAIVFKNKVYFAGFDASRGIELWVTDGTSAGTKFLKDINQGTGSSSPNYFFVYNDMLLFFAYTPDKGYELWKTNGTASGTLLVKDIYTGKGSATTGITPFFYPAAGTLFFQANDSTHGSELWKTDGTRAGTVIVKDLYPGIKSFTFSSFGYHSLNNMFIFSGKDSSTKGVNIWQSDGTKAGTVILKTLMPESANTYLNALLFSRFKDKLVFQFNGLVIKPTELIHVSQLWVTNGKKSGTVLLKDLQDNYAQAALNTQTPTINNKFYFATSSADSSMVWESNGTTNGTKTLKTIFAHGVTNYAPLILPDFHYSVTDTAINSNFNGKFFMLANDSTHGYEPWIIDGTANGTKMIKDIYKGAGSSLLVSESFSYIYSDQGLYFSASDTTSGNELWLSDGTSNGTKRIADIWPGAKYSNPFILGVVNNHLLISANDGDNAEGKTDIYKLNAIYNPLPFAKSEEAAKAVVAPDGTSFSVYPNPAKDRLNVNLNKSFGNGDISLIITDQRGREVYENKISGVYSSKYVINISSLPQGKYYLEVRTNKGMAATGFIKIK